MQRLVVDPSALAELSDAVFEAFAKRLTVNPPGRRQIQLYVGEVSPSSGTHDTVAHARRVAALPPLTAEGDGIKAYAGILLSLLGERKKYTFIDEPEAFLDPPQARELGRMISKLAFAENLRVFVATRSRDIVLGALDSGITPTVIRLSRDTKHASAGRVTPTKIRSLTAADINTLWADPIIRYSNALDGIFYETVVVAEADSDCRWYGAVLDNMRRNDPGFGRDVLFVPAGGKAKVAEIFRALVRLGVRARVTLDFDALNNVELVEKLVDAAEGAWESIEPLSRRLVSAVADKSRKMDFEQVKRDVMSVLEKHDGPTTRGLVDRVASAIPRTNGWDKAKEFGLDSLTGQQRTDAKSLLAALDSIGIVIVQSGEVESFDRDAGGHGPSWVSAALERDSHLASATTEEHLRRLLRR